MAPSGRAARNELAAPLLGDPRNGASGTPAAAADGPHASVTAAVGSGDVEAAPAAQQARAKQVAAGGSGGGTTHWALTTFILLGDMFGLGCLTLPADFVRLGWLPALACLAAFALIDLYSGLLYQRLMIRMPRAVVFDQIGEAALGAVGKAACYLTIYLTIMGEPVIFHLTSAESLAQVFYASGLSSKVASVAVAAMVLPLAQVQHMHDVGWVAIIGTVGMLLSVAVVVGKLLLMYANRAAAGGPHPKTELVAHASFESAIVGVMDIVFTYGGQVNWMRYISTMRERNKFVRAVSITTGVMTSMYLLVGVTGYTVFGSDIDLHKPITSLLPQDGWSVFMNAGLFAHCIIAYQININVWSSLLLHVLSPKLAQAMAGHHDEHDGEQHSDGGAVEGAGTGDDVPEEQQRLLSPPPPGGGGATAAVAVAPVPAVLSPLSKRLVWLAVTSLCIAYSGLTSYTFPFFSIVMAIIASLGDFASMVGLPGLFCVKLLKLPAWEVALCWSMLVLSVGLSGVGIYSSVQQLVAAMAGGGGSGGV